MPSRMKCCRPRNDKRIGTPEDGGRGERYYAHESSPTAGESGADQGTGDNVRNSDADLSNFRQLS
jgi:hypothetical protein